MSKDNIIFCYVDCFCLQEKKEDEARSILCSQYFSDRLSKNDSISSGCVAFNKTVNNVLKLDKIANIVRLLLFQQK